MEESSTYRAIIRRGWQEGTRHMLLLLGETKFGAPDDATRAAIEKIADLPLLEELAVRLMKVDTWQDLLPTKIRSGRHRTKTKPQGTAEAR